MTAGVVGRALTSPPPLFLRVADVAELLEVDPRTVRRGIDAGDIPAVRFGGVLRIPTQAFLAWAQLPQTDSEAVPARTAAASHPALAEGQDHSHDDAPHSPASTIPRAEHSRATG